MKETNQKVKKCDPFNCNRFNRLYERTWEKVSADRWIMTCPFRVEGTADCDLREGQDVMRGLPK
jgi:hypothetical protein